jgi:transcriptional regulator with PAS, ATPase and Fis domain
VFERVGEEQISWGITGTDGTTLYITGNCNELVGRLASINLSEGALISEETLGTNAISLALSNGILSSVSGPEHYRSLLQWLSTVVSPIRDRHGNVLGVIGCTKNYDRATAEATIDRLSCLMIAIAHGIETEIKQQEDLCTAGQLLSSIPLSPEYASHGMIVTNKEGKILFFNEVAESLVGRKQYEVLGDDIGKILPDSRTYKNILAGKSFVERVYLQNSSGESDTSVQLFPLRDNHGDPSGGLLILRPTRSRLAKTRRNHTARYAFQDIVGSSRAIQETIRWARLACRSSLTILLEGETGTGKELLAHAIHNSSPRRAGPFVAINCSAIPRELAESELFGYAPGAFTGSRKQGSKGKLEIADGGTLLLDEVNSLPIEIQPKLLRFLETGEVVRVGDARAVCVDVRVIACTSAGLRERVQVGEFRKDLYYRLNGFEINIPPLRDRKEDIRPISEFILDDLSRERPGTVYTLAPEVSRILLAYDWPGNVRELRNCLHRSAELALQGRITLDCLPRCMHDGEESGPSACQGKRPLEMMEREVLACVLEETQRNANEAAKVLGVSRATVYRKLKKHRLLNK